MKNTSTEQINKLLKLGMTVDEALEVIAADKEIDKGAKLFNLTPEQEKISKQMRGVGRAPTVYKLDASKREKKPNKSKREIMAILEEAITPNADKPITILNPERELEFYYNGVKYKITLSAPRK